MLGENLGNVLTCTSGQQRRLREEAVSKGTCERRTDASWGGGTEVLFRAQGTATLEMGSKTVGGCSTGLGVA